MQVLTTLPLCGFMSPQPEPEPELEKGYIQDSHTKYKPNYHKVFIDAFQVS
ncbi:hypothetical protein SPLC1_S542150 [Arthrospira platensis C1]|nr:hypothetical protein SPLC1_S542150 [Arthrospira platensis C1]